MSVRVIRLPNQIVDRTTASIRIPDIMTITASTPSSSAFLRRRSLTICRWAAVPTSLLV
jgi:hypothetical protein